MHSTSTISATAAPLILQRTRRITARIAASDAVAALVAELAYGPQRDASSWVWPTSATISREARS